MLNRITKYFDTFAGMARINFLNSDHTPSTKRYGQVKSTARLEAYVHPIAGWLDICMIETVSRDSRDVTRTIGMNLDREHALALRDFLNKTLGVL